MIAIYRPPPERTRRLLEQYESMRVSITSFLRRTVRLASTDPAFPSERFLGSLRLFLERLREHFAWEEVRSILDVAYARDSRDAGSEAADLRAEHLVLEVRLPTWVEAAEGSRGSGLSRARLGALGRLLRDLLAHERRERARIAPGARRRGEGGGPAG